MIYGGVKAMPESHLCTILAAPDPYGGQDEISYLCRDQNLHLDIISGQVAVKILCGDCGKDIGYWCYDCVEDAISNESEREEFLCSNCWVNEYGPESDDIGEIPAGHSCKILQSYARME